MRAILLTMPIACSILIASVSARLSAIEVDVGHGVHVGVGPVQVDVAGGRRLARCELFRTHNLLGAELRDTHGAKVGQVEDIVFDLGTDQIRYVAVSWTGARGPTDKWYAVPFAMLKLQREGDRNYLVLPVQGSRLSKAEGFDREHWPATGDGYWGRVDRFFAQASGK